MLTNLLEPGHLIPILLIALIIFGPKRLPEMGKSLGGALREFKRGTQGLSEELQGALKDEPVAAVEKPGVTVQTVSPVTPVSLVTPVSASPTEPSSQQHQ